MRHCRHAASDNSRSSPMEPLSASTKRLLDHFLRRREKGSEEVSETATRPSLPSSSEPQARDNDQATTVLDQVTSATSM